MTTCTAANLQYFNQSFCNIHVSQKTYVVVAAKTSTLLTFATVVNIRQKRTVNIIETASLARGRWTKYSMRMDMVGSRAASIVLIALTAATIVLSS